jgi:hypothetical protein
VEANGKPPEHTIVPHHHEIGFATRRPHANAEAFEVGVIEVFCLVLDGEGFDDALGKPGNSQGNLLLRNRLFRAPKLRLRLKSPWVAYGLQKGEKTPARLGNAWYAAFAQSSI